jgi:hypothetical protein
VFDQLYHFLGYLARVKDGIIKLMATGESLNLDLPYPVETDPVNVHGDIKSLVDRLDIVLPSASYVEIPVLNNSGSVIAAGTPLYITGHNGTHVTVGKALPSTTSPILGLAKASLSTTVVGVAVVGGILSGINTSSFSAGEVLYIDSLGGLSSSQPSGGSPAVGVVLYSHNTDGIISVGARGNATWGSLKSGLA